MKIDLTEIYTQLEAWRAERKLTTHSQQKGYIINIMEEFGELSQALRGLEIESVRKTAEHEIIDALCDIAVLTINACEVSVDKIKTIDTDEIEFDEIDELVYNCAGFSSTGFNLYDYFNAVGFNLYNYFNAVLLSCASLCEKYGYDFKIAMEETIKEISSRTGSYDERAKKWVKDTSDEARKKWYRANYELARIEKEKTN